MYIVLAIKRLWDAAKDIAVAITDDQPDELRECTTSGTSPQIASVVRDIELVTAGYNSNRIAHNNIEGMIMHIRMQRAAAILALGIAICARADASTNRELAYPVPSPLPTYPAVIHASRYAFRCVTENAARPLSDPIYKFNDIGKPSFPKIDRAYLVILKKIHAKMDEDKNTLQFTYSNNPEEDYNFSAFAAAPEEACFNQQMSFLTGSPFEKDNLTESPSYPMTDSGGWTPYPWPIVAHPKFRRVGKYGVSCKLRYLDQYATTSYSAKDIGKAGVPKLNLNEVTMIRNIQKFLPANEIRFSLLNDSDVVKGMPQGRLAVYQSADDLICANNYAFRVLNQPILSLYDPWSGSYSPETMSGYAIPPDYPWNHPVKAFNVNDSALHEIR